MTTKIILALATAAAILGGTVMVRASRAGTTRCDSYTPASGPLIAHAGGGLPDQIYADNFAALDLAAQHGFKIAEIDFQERDGTLFLGHDKPNGNTLSELVSWLGKHPGFRIVTDIKTNNVSGLGIIRTQAGTARFIPQIYNPDQFAPARAMGFRDIIFADRIGESRNWLPWVNSVNLWAVTISKDEAEKAALIRHPVFLYTVNKPMAGVGLYTDCLVPYRP